jgi:hypothetical protein
MGLDLWVIWTWIKPPFNCTILEMLLKLSTTKSQYLLYKKDSTVPNQMEYFEN